MKKTLIIGYGNPDREDDGVAWHILTFLADRLGRPDPYNPETGFEPDKQNPTLWFMLQLTPEIAETIAEYEKVCFIDAHTGSVPNDLNIEKVSSEFQRSPFTHHMTPAMCLTFVENLYNRVPEAILVSVRGYTFQFSHDLSPKTRELAQQAAEYIFRWLEA